MRIGFDAKRAFHNTTGLGNYSRDIIRLFTQKWAEHEFFLFDPAGGGISFDYNTFNTHIIKSGRQSKLAKAWWRRFALSSEIKSLHIDVFHGLSGELPGGIKNTKAKRLVTIHDVIFERFPEYYKPVDRKIYSAKARAAIRDADLVVAISEQTKADLVSLYGAPPEKIEVVYQGCNPIFSQALNASARTQLLQSFGLPEHFVLYVGTIEPRKNLHKLVAALADGNIPLVVVGRETSYMHKVHATLKNTQLAENFYHLTKISLAQLAALYQAARLFVYPSLYEGFGIPVIEALHSGTPVITGQGSMKEAGGAGCIAVDVAQLDALRNAILNVWHNTHLQNEMIDAGRAHIAQFNDDAIWQRWQDIYARL